MRAPVRLLGAWLVVWVAVLPRGWGQECPRSHQCHCEVLEKRSIRALDVDCSQKQLQRFPDLGVTT